MNLAKTEQIIGLAFNSYMSLNLTGKINKLHLTDRFPKIINYPLGSQMRLTFKSFTFMTYTK